MYYECSSTYTYIHTSVLVEVLGTFGLTISESKTDTMCMLISRAPATKIVFNAAGQQYRQTTSFTYLGAHILSYKDALQRTACESAETAMRAMRLLWSGALPRMGDHRSPKRVMSGELKNAGSVGRGGRRNNGRTAWQRIFGYLASRGSGRLPHLTLGPGIAQYVKGTVGLWSRGRRKRKTRPNTGRGRKKRKRRTRLRLRLVWL